MSILDRFWNRKAQFDDTIPGGLAEGKSPEDFDLEQLKKGIEVEMEHTSDRDIATEIAMDHLVEDPYYYEKLEKVHREEVLDQNIVENFDAKLRAVEETDVDDSGQKKPLA